MAGLKYYDWNFEGTERDPIIVSSEPAPNGAKIAVLEGVTLDSGEKITVKIMPLMVEDMAFMQSLAEVGGHQSNVDLICRLCCGWGDREFVVKEDIYDEVEAVADVAGICWELFPKRAKLVRKQESNSKANLSPKRG